MLPKISDEEMLVCILQTRKDKKLENLMAKLPIWMADRLAKKRRVSEDEKSEIRLVVIETIEKIWSLASKYDEYQVLGFFVTYTFNLFRNLQRKNGEIQTHNKLLELWREETPGCLHSAHFWESNRDHLYAQLDSLPVLTCLVVCLQYDLPILNRRKNYLEWRLAEIGREFGDFQRIYDKKKEVWLRRLALFEERVLRYTRLLYQYPESHRRKWYIQKKKEWMRHRMRVMNKSFFSEREIARILGITRKLVQVHQTKGILSLQLKAGDLLYCA
ncbi:RNA polymerase subunit sigma-70 [Leptospira sp. 'Mane']|uniref:RNA polymerase subunit sigma-70 n=1 Tax=Leptospira sp. 'Mane' TaxID=3387407 RepID=UPI00398A6288